MAMTSDRLKGFAGSTFGPVTYQADGSNLVATIQGSTAIVSAEGGAIRVSSEAEASWPADAQRQAEIDQRVSAALAGLTMARPELAVVTGDRSRSRVEATVWLDARSIDAGPLAAAVQATTVMAEAARRSIAQIAAIVQAERELVAGAERAQQEATQAIQRFATDEDDRATGPIAGASASAPPAAAMQPYWCYVEAPTDVRHISEHAIVVGIASPGTWYLCTQEAGDWVLVTDRGALEGWIPRAAARRRS